MKKIIIILLISIVAFSCKKDNFGNDLINVTINDIPNGRKVFLKKQEGRNIIVLDSSTVNNGKFSFNTPIDEPIILGVFIDSVKLGIYPFVGITDKVQITAYKDSLFASKVTGSKLHTELTELRDMRKNLTNNMKSFTSEYMAAKKDNDEKKLKEINLKAQKIQNEIALNEWSYIKANPNSHVSVMVLSGLVQNPKYADSIKTAFDGLSDEVKNSKVAKQLKEYLEKAPVAPKGN